MKIEELRKKMKGIVAVMPTPFKENGDIDFEGIRSNTSFLVEWGIGKDFAINPLGSTGEFPHISTEEAIKVMETVVEEVNGRVPVIVGTSQACTKMTVEMTKCAESVGADAAQILPPYYFTPSILKGRLID